MRSLILAIEVDRLNREMKIQNVLGKALLFIYFYNYGYREIGLCVEHGENKEFFINFFTSDS